MRVWVAGCATRRRGLLDRDAALRTCGAARYIHRRFKSSRPTLTSRRSQIAREGLYPSMIEADVSQERLREFFAEGPRPLSGAEGSCARRCSSQHTMCCGTRRSRGCDLISCRNLLIYLTRGGAADQVFDVFHFRSARGRAALPRRRGDPGSRRRALFSPIDSRAPHFRPALRAASDLEIAGRSTRTPGAPRIAGRPVSAIVRCRCPRPRMRRTGWPEPEPWPCTAGHARREALFGELHLRLLEQYGPPSVVVNETCTTSCTFRKTPVAISSSSPVSRPPT